MTTRPRRTVRLLAALGVAAGFTTVAAVLVVAGPHRSDLPARLGDTSGWVSRDPEHALAALVGLAAWVCLLWLAAGVLLAAMARLPGAAGRAAAVVSGRMLPTALRGALEVTLGVTLAAGGAAPALAAGPAHATYPATTVAMASAPATTGPSAGGRGWPDLDLPATNVRTNQVGAMNAQGTGVEAIDAGARGVPAASPTAADRRAATGGAASVAGLTGDLGATSAPAPAPPTPSPAGGSPASADVPAAGSGPTGWPDLDLPSTAATSTPRVGDRIPGASGAASSPSRASTRPLSSQPPTSQPPTSRPATSRPATAPPRSAASPTGAPTADPPTAPIPSDPPPMTPVGSTTTSTSGPGWPDLDLPVTPASTGPTVDGSAPASPPAPPTNAPAAPSPATAAASGPAPGWPDLGSASGDLIVGSSGRGTGSSGVADAAAIVVHRGDSLWSIVARQLGPGATDEQIAAAWPAWWAANRDVIGPDPNLILPGQMLRPPNGP
jgi:hypothetical protein